VESWAMISKFPATRPFGVVTW